MTKSKSLLEVIGWDESDLDQFGKYVTIDLQEGEVCFKSFKGGKKIQLSRVIKAGDSLKFPKVFETLEEEGAISLNPRNWLLRIIVWVWEFFLSVFSKYKRLNLLESSLVGFKNPSKNIADFPFDAWLVVIKPQVYSTVVNLTGIPFYLILKNPKDEALWTLGFPVFSHISLIEYEERETDISNDQCSFEHTSKDAEENIIDEDETPLNLMDRIEVVRSNEAKRLKAENKKREIKREEEEKLIIVKLSPIKAVLQELEHKHITDKDMQIDIADRCLEIRFGKSDSMLITFSLSSNMFDINSVGFYVEKYSDESGIKKF